MVLVRYFYKIFVLLIAVLIVASVYRYYENIFVQEVSEGVSTTQGPPILSVVYEFAQNNIRFGKTNDSCLVTVFAAYFAFGKSKHSQNEYKKWVKNMLVSVTAPLVIFTDTKSKDFVYQLRFSKNLPTEIVIYEDIWRLMQEFEANRNKSYIENYKNIQHGEWDSHISIGDL